MKSYSIKNKPIKRAVRALALFSGGLDSILTVKILERQGIDVTALTFVSYFFTSEEAKKSARENKIRLRVEDITPEHFCIIRKPKFGYGVGMNPCIDCHLLMLKAAKYIMKKDKYDFLATGEVLGQRPMSQNARALKLIEREAGLEEKILRPLSAKVLPKTEMEKTGLVDREKLLGVSGRGRKDQIELAKKFGIKYYPTPAGGCILTDKEYSKKLRELMAKVKNIKPSDIALLRLGRHFWVRPVRKSESPEPEPSSWVKTILGRNHEENLKLKKIAEKGDILVEPKDIPGPTALVRGKRNKDVLDFAKKLMLRYAKKTSEDISLKITAG
ncbi:MAG: tRNA 4-thiouridine(8) synthase ThiI [Candidatus Moranbacteria bacterium]|nr:tRNA 4-thiouridine(8) synthase ThiI [Candidatus Moranbacteria bacterium]